MAEPGDEIAATAGGHSRLRASHADREQVIDILKAAFVQGRLARDEFGLRVGRALASQTYADLAALTSDIPADLIGTQPPGAAREPADKEAVTAAACVSAAWTGIWVPLVVVDGIPSLVNFVLVVVLISVVPVSLAGFLLYHAWVDKRPSRQLLRGPPPGASGIQVDDTLTFTECRPPRGLSAHLAARRATCAGVAISRLVRQAR